ncbi:MAG: DNA polymerase III subunit epsilon [Pseudolabrys sp.]|nr:DNA polymerase III subunit epsilon [Pseudolabrys sp.]MBV9955160.1 DNA polymerase III subunit epsilon [Pseudolabrys sp.]
MREIVFDTETTGLDPFDGHRIVEIGCIELVNRIPSGVTFHRYVNPERDMPEAAFKVHGLSVDFLKDKPVFHDICDELMAFFGDAILIAHNASFDYGFICAELDRCKRQALTRDRLIDTIALARRKHSAGPYSLDALCVRYGIDNSRRTKHGALLDAELLAEVYLELIGARQAQLGLAELAVAAGAARAAAPRPVALAPRLSGAEQAAHREFIASLGEKALWRAYQSA